MKRAAFVLLVSAALIAGCAGRAKPTPEQAAQADHGRFPQNYKKLVQDHMALSLKDPYSAHYKFGKKPFMYWAPARYRSSPIVFGWLVCFEVNAKNGFGAYTGYKPHLALLRNGHVVRGIHPGEPLGDDTAVEKCWS